jgi:hypothetical protein
MDEKNDDSGEVKEPRVTYRALKRTRSQEEREAALTEIKRIRKKYGAPQKGWDSVKILRRMRYGE